MITPQNQQVAQEGVMDWNDFIGGQEDTVTPEIPDNTEEQEETVKEESPEEEEIQVEELQEEEVIETEKPQEKEKPASTANQSPYTSLVKKLIEKGKWQDAVIEIEDKEYTLSELEDIDEETFDAIQEQQDEIAKEESSKNFISKEGLNDVALKLIDLQKNGGDMAQAFQVYNDFVHPLEGLDLENEKVQEQLVRMHLSKKIDDPDVLDYTINKYKKDLVLDQKANDIVDLTNKAFDKYMEGQNEAAQEKKKKEQEKHQEYLKSLKGRYEKLDLKPQLKNKFLQVASSKTETGEPEALKIAREQLENPETADEFLFFLLERDTYKKSIGAKEKRENNLDTMKRIKVLKDKDRDKKQTKTTKKEEDKSGGLEFFPVDKL